MTAMGNFSRRMSNKNLIEEQTKIDIFQTALKIQRFSVQPTVKLLVDSDTDTRFLPYVFIYIGSNALRRQNLIVRNINLSLKGQSHQILDYILSSGK